MKDSLLNSDESATVYFEKIGYARKIQNAVDRMWEIYNEPETRKAKEKLFRYENPNFDTGVGKGGCAECVPYLEQGLLDLNNAIEERVIKENNNLKRSYACRLFKANNLTDSGKINR